VPSLFDPAIFFMKKLFTALSLSLLASLIHPVAAQAQNVAAGEKKAVMCIGCHGIKGYRASFPQVYRVPMISGQNSAYLVAALAGYKKGDRKHPTMQGVAATLSDQDMADLAAFYAANKDASASTKQPLAASAEVSAVLAKKNCVSCHGPDFNSPISPAYPKLAGQHTDYLYLALKAYQTQGNPRFGRNQAVMGGMAQGLSLAEMKLISEYVGSLPGSLSVVPQSRFRKH
jgi:cytochrome c553